MNESVKSRIIEQFQNVIRSWAKVTFYKDYDRNNVLIEKGSTGYIRNLKVDRVEGASKRPIQVTLPTELMNLRGVKFTTIGTANLLKFDFFDTLGREFPCREVKLFLFEAEKFLCDNSLFPFFFSGWSDPELQLENSVRISNYEYLEYIFDEGRLSSPFLPSEIPKKFAMLAVKHKTRLPEKIEEEILSDYKLSNHYSSAFDINLTESQQKEFLKDKTGSFAAKYSLDLIDRKIEVPDFLHNYLLSLKAFGNLSEIVEVKGNGEFVPSLNYFVEMYIKKSG